MLLFVILNTSMHLYIRLCLSIHWSVCRSSISPSVCWSICHTIAEIIDNGPKMFSPSIGSSVCTSIILRGIVCLSVRPSVCPSVHPSVRLSVRRSVCRSVHPSVTLEMRKYDQKRIKTCHIHCIGALSVHSLVCVSIS